VFCWKLISRRSFYSSPVLIPIESTATPIFNDQLRFSFEKNLFVQTAGPGTEAIDQQEQMDLTPTTISVNLRQLL